MFKIWRPTPNSTKPSAKDSAVQCCQVLAELFGQTGKKIRAAAEQNQPFSKFYLFMAFFRALGKQIFLVSLQIANLQILGLIPQSQVST